MNKKELFKHGPLYNKRFSIVDLIKQDMKSGDILYRYSDAKGPLNLPFTRIVSNITKSEYSHAAIMVVEHNEPYVMEINDQGTVKCRLLDWIDTCYGNNFSIYRLNEITDDQEMLLFNQIQKFLVMDCDYDFTFSDPNKFYCTESIIEVYRKALGIELDCGYYIKDIVSPFMYKTLKVGSKLFSYFGASLPFEQKVYFVGNERMGMMSSAYTKLILKI